MASYGFNWTTFDPEYIPSKDLNLNYGMDNVYHSFQYKTADELSGKPINGKMETAYAGGGYVYQMRGTKNQLVGNLTLLEQMGWIDRHTRVVFAEFAAYNPNLNLFIVATIMIEFLPSGNTLVTARFDPLNLLGSIQGVVGFQAVCNFAYMCFIVWFMFKEVHMMFRHRSKYIGFWPLVEWGIIVASWMGFGIFIYRLNTAYTVLDFFKKTSGKFINS